MIYDKFHAAALGFYGMKEYIEFIEDKWLIGTYYKMGSLSDFIKYKTESTNSATLVDDCAIYSIESSLSDSVSTKSTSSLIDSSDSFLLDSASQYDCDSIVDTTYPFKYSFNRDLNIFCASIAVLIFALLIALVLKTEKIDFI